MPQTYHKNWLEQNLKETPPRTSPLLKLPVSTLNSNLPKTSHAVIHSAVYATNSFHKVISIVTKPNAGIQLQFNKFIPVTQKDLFIYLPVLSVANNM